MKASVLAMLGVALLQPARLNDNHHPAGRLVGNTVSLALEVRETVWRPGGSAGRAIRVFAFGEAGQAPSIPGPLIRVRAGTTVRVALRNRLGRAVTIHGLHDHGGGTADSVTLAPSESRTVSFRAVTPGTYMYRGRTGTSGREIGRSLDSQLVGAFVVDSAAAGPRTHERVMVISAYDDTVKAAGFPDDHFQVFAINGRSWPSTEPATYTVGDTVHWRVINASDHFHPMHLHGFFFTVLSKGTLLADTLYAPAARREAVTESMARVTTTTLTWVASRPGHWLYHCHMIGHIATSLRLRPGAPMSHARVEDVMSGLVVAVTVKARPGSPRHPASVTAARRLRLFITEPHVGARVPPALSYVLQEGTIRPAADSALRPGSTLVLHQHEPTEIMVTNLTSRPTAVHWHGLELESYFDGVAGWSGAGKRTAPLIAPGDSFAVRLTPPRAGTFMYHTHSDETVQLAGGLFGALVVLPSGMGRRDTTERLLIIANDGLEPREAPDGTRAAGPIMLRAGVSHRLRFISIAVTSLYRIRLLSDSTEQTWRPVAKDGAELPASQATEQPAVTVMGTGETLDVEIRRAHPETLTLELRKDGAVYYRVPVVVRW